MRHYPHLFHQGALFIFVKGRADFKESLRRLLYAAYARICIAGKPSAACFALFAASFSMAGFTESRFVK